jgi:hypothetical protein
MSSTTSCGVQLLQLLLSGELNTGLLLLGGAESSVRSAEGKNRHQIFYTGQTLPPKKD